MSLNPADIPDLDPARQRFGLLVPRGFAASMRQGDAHDPLLRQVLPLRIEHIEHAGYSKDPVADTNAEHTPGLLQKYDGRALLIATGACAVHCRYCFRRHAPCQTLGACENRWEIAIGHIAADTSVHELILSGGDPLMLDDERLAELLRRLRMIGHLRRVRIHTRLPVVLPSRVTQRLCEILTAGPLAVIVVIHANHPSELDQSTEAALGKLHASGVRLFNQSVLLRAVNDNSQTLLELSERLFDCRVTPYYLHQLDRVTGAAHFQVADTEAIRLIDEMRTQTSGYLVPRLVRECPGACSKTPIS